MVAKDADKASAVAVLHHIHEHFDLPAQNVDVKQSHKHVFVVASADVQAGSIAFTPCIPRQCKVHDDNEHLKRCISRSKL